MSWTVHLYKSKGYALFLALLPVIMMYRVPGIGLGISTTIIAVGMIYAFVVILRKSRFIQWKMLLPFIIYLIYIMTKSDLTNVLICIAISFHLIAMSTGAVDINSLKKYVELIAILAVVGTILQFTIYMIFKAHLPMIISNWCLTDMDYYRQGIVTGISRNSTMYRPSAFFLEPAHLAMYCIVALCSLLFQNKPNYKKAVLVSAGILTTTSGMGIVLTAAVWLLFPILVDKRIGLKKIKRIVGIALLFLVSLVLLYRTPFFQSALARIMGPVEYSSTQYNAIWGRTVYWDIYITPLNGSELWFGNGSAAVPDVYFTGLMTIIYSYGIVGMALLYFGLIILFFKCKSLSYKIVIGIYAAMLSMADLVGLINVIFYIGSSIAITVYPLEMNNMALDKVIDKWIGDEFG